MDDASAKAVKILVVDDDDSILRAIQVLLEREHYRTLLARGGAEALEMVRDGLPQLVILDLSMPGITGLDVCRELRTWYQAPILVLSGYSEEQLVIQALDVGADDYLTKPFRSQELLARIRALLRRAARYEEPQPKITAGDLVVDFSGRRVIRAGNDIELTRTEFEILAHLVRNSESVVTLEAILDHVWGPHHGDYTQTLRVHIGHIRKKLESAPAEPRFLLTVPGVGYRFQIRAAEPGGQAAVSTAG